MMICFALRLFAQTPQKKPADTDIMFVSGIDYKASSLRDPFQTYIVSPEPIIKNKPVEPPPDPKRFEALKVLGIFWGASFPQAIIDDKVYKEGDSIDGAVIKKIDKEGITVLMAGGEYKLSPPALTKTVDDKRKPRGGKR
jgi:hypothetical protein